MKANINELPIKKHKSIPKTYNNVDGYDHLIDKHYKDGWRDVVKPDVEYNKVLGGLYFDDKNDYFTYSIETLSDEQIEDKNIQYIINKYDNHKNNGWNHYQEFRANIVIRIEKGELTEIEAFKIESFLKVAFDKISNTGDWKTAYFVLSNITTEDVLLIEYKEKALAVIGLYISENYDD